MATIVDISKITGINQVGNSYQRKSAVPLDYYSFFNTKAEAETYAASNPVAYVGQYVAYTHEGKVFACVIADTEGTLKEIGSKPIGDNASIKVAEDGTVSIFGFDSLTSAEVGYLPRVKEVVIPADPENGIEESRRLELEWAPVSAIVESDGNSVTTVSAKDTSVTVTDAASENFEGYKYEVKVNVSEAEGNKVELKDDGLFVAETDLSDYYNKEHVDAIENRVKAVEDDHLVTADKTELEGSISGVASRVTTLEGVVGNAESGLVKAIADEIARAQGAESDLSDRIDAIDFIDPTELADAIKDFATTQYVDTEIEAIEDAISKLNHFTAKVVANTDEATEIGVLYLVKDETAVGVDKYNEYIVIDGAPVLIGDTTTDLSNYYNKTEIDGKVETINNAIDAEVEAREALAEEVEALKAVDNATQEELNAYKLEVTEEIRVAKEAAISDADGKLAGKVDSTVFDTFKGENTSAIATAKSEAIADAAKAVEEAGFAVATEVEATYATKTEVTEAIEGIETALNDYAKTADVETTYATKAELTAHETAAEIAYAKKSEVYTTSEVDNLISNINQGNQATAGEVSQRLEAYKTSNDKEITNLKEKDVALTTAVETAQAQADKGVADAKTAKDAADAAQATADAAQSAVSILASGQVATNKNNIATLTTIVSGESAEDENSHAYRIGQLEAKELAHGTEYSNLAGKVNANSTDIAKKANTADVYDKTSVDNLLADKADKADTYTKTEVDNAVAAAITGANLGDYAKVTDVEAIYKAGVDGGEATGVLADEIARVDGTIAALVGEDSGKTIREIAASETAAIVAGADAKYDTLKEIADFIMNDQSGAAAMANDIVALQNKVDTGDKTVSTYVNDAIAALVSNEIAIADDGTLSITQVSTDKLVQGTDTLVLNGGNAGVQAAE
jgi:hypothetical protein